LGTLSSAGLAEESLEFDAPLYGIKRPGRVSSAKLPATQTLRLDDSHRKFRWSSPMMRNCNLLSGFERSG